jgi:hypothetical protein
MALEKMAARAVWSALPDRRNRENELGPRGVFRWIYGFNEPIRSSLISMERHIDLIRRLYARSPARRAVRGLLDAYRNHHAGPVAEAYLVRAFRLCKRFPESTTRAAVAMLLAAGEIESVGWRRTGRGGRTRLLRIARP